MYWSRCAVKVPLFEDLLTRVSTTPESRIAELTPWGWATARAAAARNAEH